MSPFLLLTFFLFLCCSLSRSVKLLKEFPLITIASKETTEIFLSEIFDGDNLDYNFDIPRKLKKDMHISYENSTRLLNSNYLSFPSILLTFKHIFNIFNDENASYNVGLSDDKRLHLFRIELFVNESAKVEEKSIFEIPNYLECSDFEPIKNDKVLVDCFQINNNDSKKHDQNNKIFILIQLGKDDSGGDIIFKNFTIKNFDERGGTFGKDNLPCKKYLKYLNGYVFRFCRFSISKEAAQFIEVYEIKDNDLLLKKNIKDTNIKHLAIQDICYYSNSIYYVLDYFKGLLLYNFTTNSLLPIYNPNLDENYYQVVVMEKNFSFGDDVFFLMIISKNYFIEIQIQDDFSFFKMAEKIRINSNFPVVPVNVFISITHFFILGIDEQQNDRNFTQKRLFVYNRNRNSSYPLVTSYELNYSDFVHFVVFESKTPLLNNIFIYFNYDNSVINVIRFDNPTLIIRCCLQQIKYETEYDLILTVKSYDESTIQKIKIIYININDTSLKLFYSSSLLDFKSNSPSFCFDFEDYVRGPNKKFNLSSNYTNFSGGVTNEINIQILDLFDNSTYPFFSIFKIKENEYFFIREFENGTVSFKIYNSLFQEKWWKNINGSGVDSVFFNFKNYSLLNIELVIKWRNLEKSLSYFNFLPFFGKYVRNDINLLFDCKVFDVNFDYNYGICIENHYDYSVWHEIILNNGNSTSKRLANQYMRPTKIDLSLISQNLIFIHSENGFQIFKFDFKSGSLSELATLSSEYITCSTKKTTTCYDVCPRFNAFNLKITFLVFNYEENIITEINWDYSIGFDLARIIPLYSYKMINSRENCFNKILNKNFLSLYLTLGNASAVGLYDLNEQNQNMLVRVIHLEEIEDFILIKSTNKENDSFFEFLTKNTSYYYHRIDKLQFCGSLNLKRSYINGESFNNTFICNYSFESPDKIDIKMGVSNGMNDSPLIANLIVNFNFVNSFLNFSGLLFKNFVNMTNVKINEQGKELKLLDYFSGPIYKYNLSSINLTNQASSTYLKSHITFIMKYELNKCLSQCFQNEIKASLMSNDYLLILKNNSLLVFDSKKYELVNTIFFIDKSNENIYCNDLRFSINEPSYLLILCYKSQNDIPIPLINILNVTELSKKPEDIKMNTFLNLTFNYIYDIQFDNDIFFIVQKNELDFIIKIFKCDMYIYPIYLGAISASQFEINNLYISSLAIKSYFNNLFGILFTDSSNIFYCTIFIQYDYSKFTINDYGKILFKDVINSLNKQTINIEDDSKYLTNIHWNNFTADGINWNLSLHLTTNNNLIEIGMNTCCFADFYISRVFFNYLECYNMKNFNSQVLDGFVINACSQEESSVLRNDFKKYLSIYNLNHNSNQSNDSVLIVYNSLEALEFSLDELSNYFLKSTDKKTFLIVLTKNMEVFEYQLNEFLVLLFESDISAFQNDYYLSAVNEFCKANIRINIARVVDRTKMRSFFGLVLIPVILCISILIFLNFSIRWMKRKRRIIIIKSYAKFIKDKVSVGYFESSSESQFSLE